MTFYAFGVNHLRAPLSVREAFALELENARKLYRSLALDGATELILLSTCNRSEVYLYGTRPDVDRIQSGIELAAGTAWPDEHSFLIQDEEAVRHVLEVAAGLKSLVLGDSQIFSQLKEAYRIASEEQRVGTTMHRLMHTAFRTAKRVINETDLSTGAASIPFQAVEVAQSHMQSRMGKSLSDVRALVIGSGSMGRLAGEALLSAGIRNIAFTNRSAERAKRAAEKHRATFVHWDRRHVESMQRDLVIVATSADQPVIRTASLQPYTETETLFIDISVPRNVEAGVEDLVGVTVVDLDELSHFIQETEELRKTAVPLAQSIVDETLSEFVAWVFHHQALQPAIQAIADTFERIRDQEVSRHHSRFSEADREELDRITRSIIQKILAVPIVRLKSVDPESIDFVHGVELLNALFRRDSCDDAQEAPRSISEDASPDQDRPRDDCPIEPEFSGSASSSTLSEEDLRDVLRQFAREDKREVE